jgi:hypothetical protein
MAQIFSFPVTRGSLSAFWSIRKQPLEVGIGGTFENNFASDKHDDFIGKLVDQVEVM